MIIEIFIAFVFIIVLLRLLYPELFVPIPPTGVIRGKLTTASGSVVDEATVVLTLDGGTKNVVSSITDGTYVFPAIGLGTYKVTAHYDNADGSWLEGSSDVVLDAATKTVDITMVYTRAAQTL
jgi:hypothetical protein